MTTFLLTLLVDLTVGIGVGMVLAAFLFIRRMAAVTLISSVGDEADEADEAVRAGDPYETDPNAARRRSVPKGVEVYEINGPFFFGAAESFRDTIGQVARKPRVLVIRMRHVPALDSTGMYALSELARRSRKDGTTVLLSEVHMQPMVALSGSPAPIEIGEENLFDNLDAALARARDLVGGAITESRHPSRVASELRQRLRGGARLRIRRRGQVQVATR